MNVRSAAFSNYNPQCEDSLKHEIAEKIKSTIDDFMKLNERIGKTFRKSNDCDDLSCQLQDYTNMLLSVFDLVRKQLFALGSISSELLRCSGDAIDYLLENDRDN